MHKEIFHKYNGLTNHTKEFYAQAIDSNNLVVTPKLYLLPMIRNWRVDQLNNFIHEYAFLAGKLKTA